MKSLDNMEGSRIHQLIQKVSSYMFQFPYIPGKSTLIANVLLWAPIFKPDSSEAVIMNSVCVQSQSDPLLKDIELAIIRSVISENGTNFWSRRGGQEPTNDTPCLPIHLCMAPDTQRWQSTPSWWTHYHCPHYPKNADTATSPQSACRNHKDQAECSAMLLLAWH